MAFVLRLPRKISCLPVVIFRGWEMWVPFQECNSHGQAQMFVDITIYEAVVLAACDQGLSRAQQRHCIGRMFQGRFGQKRIWEYMRYIVRTLTIYCLHHVCTHIFLHILFDFSILINFLGELLLSWDFQWKQQGPVPLSGATLPCLQMLGPLQRAAVPLLKVGIDQGDPCGKQLIGQR